MLGVEMKKDSTKMLEIWSGVGSEGKYSMKFFQNKLVVFFLLI